MHQHKALLGVGEAAHGGARLQGGPQAGVHRGHQHGQRIHFERHIGHHAGAGEGGVQRAAQAVRPGRQDQRLVTQFGQRHAG
ncbi:hypothetical protein D9M68_921700 [compost metagenome]